MSKITAIQPTREQNYSEWYLEVIKEAELAEHSSVRGCMVIRPWGYSIWENLQRFLDGMIKETGHQNAYFPLFIPLSSLQKEAEHVEGFAKECAVVTHHRLEKNAKGVLVPAGELEEPLVIRPTSEMIIGETFAKWVKSYRDLPLLINQWCNVVRWEMRTRLFLRTAEILWQEGHTAHATKEGAVEETLKMLHVYDSLAREYLAIPTILGVKTSSERFPGAVETWCLEAMMQDRKALQVGTAHFLGQNFAKAADIKFDDENGDQSHVWTTSWGVTTRLIGALVMTHSDDDGLVLPPRIAPSHIVLLPVLHKGEQRDSVLAYCRTLADTLKHSKVFGEPIRVVIDGRDVRGGEKNWSWIKKGIPLRIEVGPRDIASNRFGVLRRDRPHKEATWFSKEELLANAGNILEEMHKGLYEKAKEFRDAHIKAIDTKEEFYAFFTPKNRENPESHGGFALCHWGGGENVETQVKNDLGVTIRCVPLDRQEEEGRCVISGRPSKKRVIFAKSY